MSPDDSADEAETQSEDSTSDESEPESESETGYYRVVHSPFDGTAPGEIVEVEESTAEAFGTNLEAVDADSKEEAEEQAAAQTATEEDFDPEAGTFEVQHSPLGGVEPGDTIDLDADTARAFSDNLAVATNDGDSEESADVEQTDRTGASAEATRETAAEAALDENDSPAESTDRTGASADATETASGGDGDSSTSLDPAEMSVEKVKEKLDENDVSVEELEDLRDYEKEHDNRSTLIEDLENRIEDKQS